MPVSLPAMGPSCHGGALTCLADLLTLRPDDAKGRLMIASANTKTAISARTGVLPALLAIALGLFFVYGVGFAAPSAIHNAAHDTRHTLAFPCH